MTETFLKVGDKIIINEDYPFNLRAEITRIFWWLGQEKVYVIAEDGRQYRLCATNFRLTE